MIATLLLAGIGFLFLLHVRARVVSEQYQLSQEIKAYEKAKRENMELKRFREELLRPERLRALAKKLKFHPPREEEIWR